MADISTNINRAIADFDSIRTAIENKGVTVGNSPTSRYADKIRDIGGQDNKKILVRNAQSVDATLTMGILGFTGYRGGAGCLAVVPSTNNQEIKCNALIQPDYSRIIAKCSAILKNTEATVSMVITSEPLSSTNTKSGVIDENIIIKRINIITEKVNDIYCGFLVFDVDVSDILQPFSVAIQQKAANLMLNDLWLE